MNTATLAPWGFGAHRAHLPPVLRFTFLPCAPACASNSCSPWSSTLSPSQAPSSWPRDAASASSAPPLNAFSPPPLALGGFDGRSENAASGAKHGRTLAALLAASPPLLRLLPTYSTAPPSALPSPLPTPPPTLPVLPSAAPPCKASGKGRRASARQSRAAAATMAARWPLKGSSGSHRRRSSRRAALLAARVAALALADVKPNWSRTLSSGAP